MESLFLSRIDHFENQLKRLENLIALKAPSKSDIDEIHNITLDLLVGLNKLPDAAVTAYFGTKVFVGITEQQRDAQEKQLGFPLGGSMEKYQEYIKRHKMAKYQADHAKLFDIFLKYQPFSSRKSDILVFVRDQANRAHRVPIIQLPRNRHIDVVIQDTIRISPGASVRLKNVIVKGKRLLNFSVKDGQASGLVDPGTKIEIQTRYVYKLLGRDVGSLCRAAFLEVSELVQDISRL